MSNHGLRTTGRPTGNFGRQKVKGKPGDLDLTKEILSKDNLRIPDRNEAFTRLLDAYNKTSDSKLKMSLGQMLAQRRAATNPITIQTNERPNSEYWDMVRATR